MRDVQARSRWEWAKLCFYGAFDDQSSSQETSSWDKDSRRLWPVHDPGFEARSRRIDVSPSWPLAMGYHSCTDPGTAEAHFRACAIATSLRNHPPISDQAEVLACVFHLTLSNRANDVLEWPMTYVIFRCNYRPIASGGTARRPRRMNFPQRRRASQQPGPHAFRAGQARAAVQRYVPSTCLSMRCYSRPEQGDDALASSHCLGP